MSTTTKQAIEYLQTLLHRINYPDPQDKMTIIAVSEVYDINLPVRWRMG